MSAVILQVHSTGTGPGLWASYTGEPIAGARRVTPALIGYPGGPALARGEVVKAADDARHLLAQVPGDAEAVHLVAHSYGASVALELAPLLGSRLRSLFLFEPVLFGALARQADADPAALREAQGFAEQRWFLDDAEVAGTDPWLERFIDYWNRPGSWARMPEPLRAATRRVGWKMYQEVRSCFHDVAAFADRPIARVPATLVMGERSPAASRAMARALHASNPWARLVELPGVGHMGPLTHPAVVQPALNEHLAAAVA